MEDEAPGGTSLADVSTLAGFVDLQVEQLELTESEVNGEAIDDESSVVDKLPSFPYQVFVLSETGRPIFVSCGFEDQLCALFALINVFVIRVEAQGDQLFSMSSGDIHVQFSHRSPLILCIVSRSAELLEDQLSILFDQILSTLSKQQLESIYEKRGDNYDLRRLLRGTDKYMDSSIGAWRSDVSLLKTAIRVLPMQPSDRDFLSTTMASCLAAAKADGIMFGLVLAHRQVVAQVRLKKYVIHPRDVHILINLVTGNTSMRLPEAQTWTPICLPKFDSSGFFYAYIAYPWEGSAACILLLSVKRDHFDILNEVKKQIVSKLESNQKFFNAFTAAIETPSAFNITNISGADNLWSFVYKNRTSKQICLSSAKPPVITRDVRRAMRRLTEKVTHLIRTERGVRLLFVRRKTDNILVWVMEKFTLQCVFAPFVTAQAATAIIERLLKSLKELCTYLTFLTVLL